jgi:RNA polymerase sigma factor (sigma-70 family)
MSRQTTDASAQLRGSVGSLPLEQRADGELLDCFVTAHDERAFAALLQRYSSLVYGVCARLLQNSHDAEDAFQATFLVLARKAASLDGQGPLGNWLYTVAFRTATKARAAKAKRRSHERHAQETPMAYPTNGSEWEELRPVLDEELHRLPKKYRSVLILCYFEGKTHQEAARQLGWPSGSLSRRMQRARELLRHRLTVRGITLSSFLLFGLISRKASAATVPPKAAAATVRAAVLFAAGKFAGHTGVSVNAIRLAESMLSTVIGWKLVAVGALALGLGALGISGVEFLVAARAGVRNFSPAMASVPGAAMPPATCNDNGSANVPQTMAREALRLAVDEEQIGTVALAPAGNWLAIAGRGAEERVRVWELGKGSDLAPPRKPPFVVLATGTQALAFSADGSLLAAGGSDGTIAVWRVGSHSTIWRVQGHEGEGTAIGFSPDGQFLASGASDGTVRLRNAANGNEVESLQGEANSIHSIAFSRGGTKLATGSNDGFIRVWDMSSRKSYAAWQAHAGSILSLSISSDAKRLISAGADRSLRIWNMKTGQPCADGVSLSGTMVGAAFVGGNLAVSLEADGNLRFWNTRALSEIQSSRSAAGDATVFAVAAGRPVIATVGSDRTARLWQIKGPAVLQ